MMAVTTKGACQDCGRPCARTAKRCVTCYTATRLLRVCINCGCKTSRRGRRCLTCYWDQREAAASQETACRDCGGRCAPGATRCRACYIAEQERAAFPDSKREAMRAAALRRYAHVAERREQAARLWQAGHTLAEIAQAVGISEVRVGVDLDRIGARPFGTERRVRHAG